MMVCGGWIARNEYLFWEGQTERTGMCLVLAVLFGRRPWRKTLPKDGDQRECSGSSASFFCREIAFCGEVEGNVLADACSDVKE